MLLPGSGAKMSDSRCDAMPALLTLITATAVALMHLGTLYSNCRRNCPCTSVGGRPFSIVVTPPAALATAASRTGVVLLLCEKSWPGPRCQGSYRLRKHSWWGMSRSLSSAGHRYRRCPGSDIIRHDDVICAIAVDVRAVVIRKRSGCDADRVRGIGRGVAGRVDHGCSPSYRGALVLVPGWMIPVEPLNPYVSPGFTRLDKSDCHRRRGRGTVPESSQPMVIWPGSTDVWFEFVVLPALITSCGCVFRCEPKLPLRLTVVTPLKAKGDSFPVGLGMGVPTISSALSGLKPGPL